MYWNCVHFWESAVFDIGGKSTVLNMVWYSVVCCGALSFWDPRVKYQCDAFPVSRIPFYIVSEWHYFKTEYVKVLRLNFVIELYSSEKLIAITWHNLYKYFDTFLRYRI